MRNPVTLARFIAAALLLFIPFTALSAVNISADDTIAGLGTDITVKDVTNDTAVVIITAPTNTKKIVNVPSNGYIRLLGESTRNVGTYDVRLEVNGKETDSTTFDVLPEKLDPQSSSIKTDRVTIEPSGNDEIEVIVRLQDRFGNVLPGRPIELISNRSKDRVRLITGETDVTGEQRFVVSTMEEGTITLRAIDLLSGELLKNSININTGMMPPQQSFGGYDNRATYPFPPARGNRIFYAQTTNGFDGIDHFEISAPAQLSTGVEAQKIVIRAVDQSGKTVEDYIGTVIFSSTDPNASLPAFGSYTFQQRDLGVREFPLALKFQTPGEHVFRIEDKLNAQISGETVVTITGTIGIPDERKIFVTSHKNEQTISSPTIILEGKGPPFVNLIVMGGIADVYDETDQQGNFSIPIALNPEQRDFTIRIRDDRGQNDSGPIHLILDSIPPPIESIEFSPEKPTEGSNVLLVVISEPGLQNLTMTIDHDDGRIEEMALRENESASGSYQLLFEAPNAKTYQPIIRAIDEAGNKTEIKTILNVESKSMPKVLNVRAMPKANAVLLEWDSIGTEVDEYRIYVGEEPTDFLYNLDTDRPATKATVSGLFPGRTYYFALTALFGGAESNEKSDIVQARVQGLALDITEEDSSLLIEWSDLPTDIPLNSFLLEYGTEPGTYEEKRTLNGDMKAYTLRDLLNDVTYYIRLTPITITGDVLDDLTAVGQGTPHGLIAGFRPGPADPLQFSTGQPPAQQRPIGSSTLQNVPSAYPSGIPSSGSWVAIVITVFFAGIYIKRRRTIKADMAFLQAIEHMYTK